MDEFILIFRHEDGLKVLPPGNAGLDETNKRLDGNDLGPKRIIGRHFKNGACLNPVEF